MEKKWTGIISLGIVHPMIYPETLQGEGPILETITKIVTDDFFGAIEVSWIKDPNVREKVANLLEASYVDLSLIHI